MRSLIHGIGSMFFSPAPLSQAPQFKSNYFKNDQDALFYDALMIAKDMQKASKRIELGELEQYEQKK